ncbi:type IV secretory pathway, VirB4 component [Klebsiella pneumoniae]|nr:type IV secretory pathway, VirB4 component [Klebsiella pneumoniae]
MFSLFTREKAAAPVPQAEEKAVLKPSLRKSGKLKISDEQARYHREPPLIDYLPWVEYLPSSQSILLDDGVSVGAVRKGVRRSAWRRSVTSLKTPFRTALTSGILARG